MSECRACYFYIVSEIGKADLKRNKVVFPNVNSIASVITSVMGIILKLKHIFSDYHKRASASLYDSGINASKAVYGFLNAFSKHVRTVLICGSSPDNSVIG